MKATKKVIYNVKDFELTFEPIEDSIKIEKTKKGYTVKYLTDDNDPLNPRIDFDNCGHMVCFHNRYDLGDKHDISKNSIADWCELESVLKEEYNACIVLPLYLYDHSGISIKIGDFYNVGLPQGHARFDSGQVGFIYVTDEDIKKNYIKKRVTKQLLKKAVELLKAEVDTYNKYLTGEIYTIVKEEFDKNKKQVDFDTGGGYIGYEDSLKALDSEI